MTLSAFNSDPEMATKHENFKTKCVNVRGHMTKPNIQYDFCVSVWMALHCGFVVTNVLKKHWNIYMNISLISNNQTSTMWPSFPPPSHHSFSMSTPPFYCLPYLPPPLGPPYVPILHPACPTSAHLSFPLPYTPFLPLPPPFLSRSSPLPFH